MIPERIGRYEIKSELGRGGMATVYYAHDPRFKRDVAIKVLPREFLHDPTFRARFEREAQTIALLEHPAIVPVYDFGEDAEQLYLVMRFMPGGSLDGRLKRGPLSVVDAARLLNRLSPALDEAHAHGVIHRDLKPDNILFDQHGEPYISDFGIAKLAESGTAVTANTIIGTPAYMSPEQARGLAKLDGRSDIYALGVILFEVLTGQKPYNADTPMGLAVKHITDPVPRILKIKPDLPPGVERIIARAMAKQPEARFPTAQEMATAFSQVANGTGPTLVDSERTLLLPPDEQDLAPTREIKRRLNTIPLWGWLWIGGGLLSLCLCGMLATRMLSALFGSGGTTPTPTELSQVLTVGPLVVATASTTPQTLSSPPATPLTPGGILIPSDTPTSSQPQPPGVTPSSTPTARPTRTSNPLFTPTETAVSPPTRTSTPNRTSTPTDAPVETNTPIRTPTSAPPTPTETNTPSRTPTDTATPLPPTFTASPAPSSTPTFTLSPTPTPVVLRGSLYLHNDPSPPFEDTNSHVSLPMDLTPPVAASLFNYDADRDSSAGLLIQKGGISLDERDPGKHQRWKSATTDVPAVTNGAPRLVYWGAVKDFDDKKRGAVSAYLAATDGVNVDWVISGRTRRQDWPRASDWVEISLDFEPPTPLTIPAGFWLELVLVVDDSSQEDLWFAYDTVTYPMRLEWP